MTHGATGPHWGGWIDTGFLTGERKVSTPPFSSAGIIYTAPKRLSDCEGEAASFWTGLDG